MATSIEARYKATTPMFCGGADGMGAELRLPSFKGSLRFWWRALAWARLNGDLESIKKEEDELFGSAGGGQSRVLMKLGTDTEPPTLLSEGETLRMTQSDRAPVVGEGARYLGYGVMYAFPSRRTGVVAGQLTRACLYAPFEFTVKMRCRGLDETALESLKDALIALGLLGGMGAKSRKGYGSLALQSLLVDGEEAWSAARTARDLNGEIWRLIKLHPSPSEPLPNYTALNQDSRHVLVAANTDRPLELLDMVGKEIVRYRSWGHQGRVLGAPSERLFQDDHDLMKASARSRTSHPRRVAFGLPHNYGRNPNEQVGPASGNYDRRASPLFIHIHECGTKPIAVLSLFPTRFLPEGDSGISVGGKVVRQTPEKELYKPVHAFLDRILDPNSRKETFMAVEARR